MFDNYTVHLAEPTFVSLGRDALECNCSVAKALCRGDNHLEVWYTAFGRSATSAEGMNRLGAAPQAQKSL